MVWRIAMTDLPNTQVVIGPNASMSARMALGFLGLLALVSFGIAGLFAWQGFWPIVPFAGLEVGAFGLALWVCLRRNRYREVLGFEGDRLHVECGIAGGAKLMVDWPRSSTRVLVEAGRNRHETTRLVLSNGGRILVIGRFLIDVERERLARRLRGLIHPGFVPRAQPVDEEPPADFIF
jgi:uncharacterized membrane protein